MTTQEENKAMQAMEILNAELNENIKKEGLKPIFADGVTISFRIKAKPKKANDPKQGMNITNALIEIIFMDVNKQQPLGRFVVDRPTAEDISRILNDSIKKLDEIMEKNELPKQNTMPKDTHSSSSYR